MTTARGLAATQTFLEAADDIAGQADLEHTQTRLVELAQKVMGFGGAGLWTGQANGDLILAARSDPGACDPFFNVRKDVAHPVRTCFDARTTIRVDDVRTDDRWTGSDALAAGTLIRSAVAFYVSTPVRPLGVLTFYHTEPSAYSEQDFEVAATFTWTASHVLDAASQNDKARHLQIALDTNRRIAMAVGVVMAMRRVNETEAFDMLRRASQDKHVKVRELAETVLLTGAVPGT